MKQVKFKQWFAIALFGGALPIHAGEYWISSVGTDNTADASVVGSAAVPWIAPTAGSFDALINGTKIPANSTIHLMAGTFLTLNGVTVKPGWKIVGAGMDVTTVKLDVVSSSDWDATVIGGNGNGVGNYWYYAKDNVAVSDLTVDMNLQNQTVPLKRGAVGLSGNNSRISRVKVLNWGSTYENAETFILNISGGVNSGEIKTNAVIEDCIIGNAAPTQLWDGVTAISICGGGDANHIGTPGPGWIVGAEIRRCVITGVRCGTSGSFQQPTYLQGFHLSGVQGGKICNNLAVDLGPYVSVIYLECGSVIDYVVENNMFLDVNTGVFFQGYSGSGNACMNSSIVRRNLNFRNNIITLKSGGMGINVSGNNLIRLQNVQVHDNTIYAADGATAIGNGVTVQTSDGVTIANNTIDPNGGIGVYTLNNTGLLIDDNRKFDGTDTTTSGYSIPTKKASFTPSSAGWYRLVSGVNMSSGTIRVYSGSFDGKITDLEFNYDIPFSANAGNITVQRNLRYSGGHISKLRISSDPYLAGTMTAVDIYIPTASTPGPMYVEWKSGNEIYVGQLAVTFLTDNSTPPACQNERILDISAPGFHTTAPIYASAQQVTDSSGKILASALPIGTDVQQHSTKLDDMASSATTSTEFGYLSGVTSPLQTQLNGMVNKAGDTMTGALRLPAGSVAAPSLVYNTSGNDGLYFPGSGMLSLVTGGTERMKFAGYGVGLGSGALSGFYGCGYFSGLDICNGAGPASIIWGAEENATTRGNNTVKTARLALAPYTTSDAAVATIMARNYADSSQVNIGGGTSTLNGVTEIGFYTAAAVNTLAGTRRWLMNNSGNFLPGADNSYDIGASSARVRNITAVGLATVGGVATAISTKTASYTLTSTDTTILLNGTALTATLPTASTVAGHIYTIKLVKSGTTATVSSASTIDGATSYSLSAQYKYVTVQSDGSVWWIIGKN